MSEVNVRKGQFTLEITTTALCNMACTYCFEGLKINKQVLTTPKVEALKSKIKELLESGWWNKRFDSLNISFWGGEPTLNHELIVDIMQTFQEDDRIDFHIYTNALDRGRMDKVLDNVDTKKLRVQVSWDGDVINRKYSVQGVGTDTTQRVLENMKYLVRRGINTSMKATVPLESMEDIESSWDSYHRLHNEMGKDGSMITYAPTIDYVNELPKVDLEKSIATFRAGMLRVAKKELAFHKKWGHFLCTWFDGSEDKVHCASGANMVAVDVTGKTYACHGSLYSPNKDAMGSGSIMDHDWINTLKGETEKYAFAIKSVPEICTDCVATTCMICPVVSMDNSKKEGLMDQWTDRWVNNMCGYFKTFGEIDRAVMKQIRSDNYGV